MIIDAQRVFLLQGSLKQLDNKVLYLSLRTQVMLQDKEDHAALTTFGNLTKQIKQAGGATDRRTAEETVAYINKVWGVTSLIHFHADIVAFHKHDSDIDKQRPTPGFNFLILHKVIIWVCEPV